MTSTRLIFEIFLVLMWRPYRVQFCLLHILLYLIRQITGSDLSQTYVRKYYLHLGPDAGVSRGSSCVCTCISTVAMTLSEVIGGFFYPKVDLYLVTVRIHPTPTPRVYHDEGFRFFVWNPLFTQVVTILSHACDEIHKRPWYVCAFSAELVHISVEKISEYHTLMDKPNLTLLYNGSCVPSVTFLKHILYILSQFSI